MTFSANSEAFARSAMGATNPDLTEKFVHLIKLLSMNPEAASKMRGNNSPAVGTEAYIRAQAASFSSSRVPRAPEPPATVPDEMVSFILHNYFSVPEANLKRAKNEHLLSMGAENLVGELLERYLASVMEPRGWVWCSGSTVKAVDLIKPPITQGAPWKLLQVKNRDNSENSSSSAIRNGTDIEKWFRTFSKKTGSNWAAFPDTEIRPLVSEAGFRKFVKEYLLALK
jgi:SinI restriction endonuclease